MLIGLGCVMSSSIDKAAIRQAVLKALSPKQPHPHLSCLSAGSRFGNECLPGLGAAVVDILDRQVQLVFVMLACFPPLA